MAPFSMAGCIVLSVDSLMGIAAVVLGGASIFGGRGTVLGTVLGLFAIVILQNGLRLSEQPAELAGILTGALLVSTIIHDRLSRRAHARTPALARADTGLQTWTSTVTT